MGKARILIIEENDSTRRWLHANLEEDFLVLDANSSEQMIKILDDKRVSLVLIDDSFSHERGLEFCESIRKRRRFNVLPVLVITSPKIPYPRFE